MARKRTRKAANDEPAIDRFAAQHGDYGTTTVVDLTGELGGRRQSMVRLLRNLYPSIVDRWLAEGGTGFDEPQRAAIEHVRGLWGTLGTQRLVANYDGPVISGGDDDGNVNQIFALAQLKEYEEQFPRAYWCVFENCVRYDMPAGRAGSHLARNPAQCIAAARTTVGFVASKIAEWRGY